MVDKCVLIAVDAGERALDAVRLGEMLARIGGVPVALATVFPYIPFEDRVQRRLREEAEETLRELGATIEGAEVADVRAVEARSVPKALQQLSEEQRAAVVVVGSSARGPIGRVVPGTTAERLLHGAASPVAVAPSGFASREGELKGIIGAGFDGSEESRLALDGAASLARRAGARLRIVAVHEPSGILAVSTSGGVAIPTDELDRRLEESLRASLDEAVTAMRSEGLDVEDVFTTGDPARVLADQSAEFDVLITGSRGYGPIGAVMLGDTTHRLLTASVCPLIVTPRGRPLALDG